MRRRLACALVTACCVAACKSKPAEPGPAPPPTAAEPEPAPPPTAAIPEAALQQLLERWLAAQNQGQFEAYQALYASKFFGVKRAGLREFRFDRDGWLKDRGRMFQKPMKVEAREPKFQPSSASAELTFTQRWASGNFEDVGAKRMLVVREAGQLKIAQEELLRSDVVAGTPARSAGETDFYFTLELDSGLYLSLPAAPVPGKLGAMRLESGESDSTMYTVSRPVGEGALDAASAAWKTRKLRLEGGCVASVGEFRVLSRVVPHFGEVQRWNGQWSDEDQPPSKPVPRAQVARSAYAMGNPALFAKLEGCCEGSYARLETSPQPIAAETVEDKDLEQRARAAFLKLPAVVQEQQNYLKEIEGATGRWTDENTDVAIYRHPKSGQTLVSVRASYGDGCGEYGAAEWAVFEVQGKTMRRLLPARTPPNAIEQALDIDGDGKLELLVVPGWDADRELVWPGAEREGPALEYAYQDCPC